MFLFFGMKDIDEITTSAKNEISFGRQICTYAVKFPITQCLLQLAKLQLLRLGIVNNDGQIKFAVRNRDRVKCV